jgi:hypothetical protein
LELIIENWDCEDSESIDEKVAEAVSSVLKSGLKGVGAECAGLSLLLDTLFGIESEISSQAHRFEDLINGYFGDVEFDDMEEAQTILDDLISDLRSYLRQNEAPPPLFGDAGV